MPYSSSRRHALLLCVLSGLAFATPALAQQRQAGEPATPGGQLLRLLGFQRAEPVTPQGAPAPNRYNPRGNDAGPGPLGSEARQPGVRSPGDLPRTQVGGHNPGGRLFADAPQLRRAPGYRSNPYAQANRRAAGQQTARRAQSPSTSNPPLGSDYPANGGGGGGGGGNR